ncbi:hypothetical protein CW745_11230 [Psychromonas sp. psych-6C06]|uniref:pilus assembly PilX N-terminal domain-containing protein n=1 Tax=Psychromonas sp. psych-6C06 TaxID=2058089 RepID=UPI000C33C925|nr:pilus assembly PilX N-terminal domain-containing protein [Psychromonas sp. psych-6C06]PKF61198.1 hypothetical protein CW745_11230 [Psychromonas sp. psych-6C06]
MKNFQGFVLISVLLITTIASVLAMNSIQESKLQERIGGNQQKELNARLKAEKGIFDSFAYIKSTYAAATVSSAPSAEDVKSHIESLFTDNDFIDVVITEQDRTYKLMSTGMYHGATAYLKAEILAKLPGEDIINNDAVVGCDGVVIKGSGHVDSFDSSLGAYNSEVTVDGVLKNNKNARATVSTLTDNKDINLSGSAPVWGNVKATGNFNMNGSSSVVGNISAKQNVTFASKAADSPFAYAVTGNVATGGNFDANTNTVTGNASVMGVASNTSQVGITDGERTGKVIYGENGSMSGEESTHAGEYEQDYSLAAPDIDVGECDVRDIASEVLNYQNFASNGDFLSNIPDGQAYEFTQNSAHIWDADTNQLETKNAVSVNVLGNSKKAHVFDNFTLNGRDMTIKGDKDVVIVVKGDFLLGSAGVTGTKQKGESADGTYSSHTAGGETYLVDDNNNRVDSEGYRITENDDYVTRAAAINVEEGSSLTLIVMGKMETKTGTQVQYVASTSDDPKPKSGSPLAIYSTYNSNDNPSGTEDEFEDLAVDIQSTDMAATVYAPKGHVAVKASGEFMGSVRGKTVLVSGDGGLHYDESLAGESRLPINSGPSLYTNVYYYYPEN